MRSLRRLLTLILVLGVLVSGSRPTHAQDENQKYFPETGHTVAGEFLTYYNSVSDPLLLFGYPITEAFDDPLLKITVQYFQRARFELRIDKEPGQRVQLTSLGEILYQPGPEVQFPTDTPSCRYFLQQKHYVCYAFLDFFNAYGGVAQFGTPLSNIEIQDDLYVQYFQRVRFEWHPELPAGHRVTLADLGKAYADARGVSTTPQPPNSNLPGNLHDQIQIKTHAFVAKAVIAPNSRQTLFVIVQDQFLRGVQDANVAITVHLPGVPAQLYRFPLTNADGVSQSTFNVGSLPVDQSVPVDVEVVKGDLQDKASTWFRIWY